MMNDEMKACLDMRFGWRSRVKKHVEDRARVMSEWTDRDMLIGGHLYPARTITIADVLDHAARAAIEATTVKGEGLVERLRHLSSVLRSGFLVPKTRDALTTDEAADTITTLKGEIERLDAALRQIEAEPAMDVAGQAVLSADRVHTTARQALGSTDNVG